MGPPLEGHQLRLVPRPTRELHGRASRGFPTPIVRICKIANVIQFSSRFEAGLGAPK